MQNCHLFEETRGQALRGLVPAVRRKKSHQSLFDQVSRKGALSPTMRIKTKIFHFSGIPHRLVLIPLQGVLYKLRSNGFNLFC